MHHTKHVGNLSIYNLTYIKIADLYEEIEVELMKNYNSKNDLNTDIEAVITSYNQGTMILEAVQSICNQTLLPQRIISVDDGSTDNDALAVLEDIQNNPCMPIPITIYFQENRGVSAARNAGINKAQSSTVLVLDGDDKLEAGYIEHVSKLLCDDPTMVIASSWMHTFGVLDAIVCPTGGNGYRFILDAYVWGFGCNCLSHWWQYSSFFIS